MDDKNIVIDVSDVTVRFNRASQQVNNLKEYVIRTIKRNKEKSRKEVNIGRTKKRACYGVSYSG